jgi:hypothetical protein
MISRAQQIQQVHCELGDVFAPLPQRRHVDAHAAEALEGIRQHPPVNRRCSAGRACRPSTFPLSTFYL